MEKLKIANVEFLDICQFTYSKNLFTSFQTLQVNYKVEKLWLIKERALLSPEE